MDGVVAQARAESEIVDGQMIQIGPVTWFLPSLPHGSEIMAAKPSCTITRVYRRKGVAKI